MIDPEVFREMVQERLFLPYTFKLKVFQDTYNDEARTKVGGRCVGGWYRQARCWVGDSECMVLPKKYKRKVVYDTYYRNVRTKVCFAMGRQAKNRMLLQHTPASSPAGRRMRMCLCTGDFL